MSAPRLLHYSMKPEPIATAACEQPSPYPFGSRGDTHFKPRGLWFSVEGDHDWRSWCIGEQFRLEHLRHVHQLVLRDEMILTIADADQLRAFARDYATDNSLEAVRAAAAACGADLESSDKYLALVAAARGSAPGLYAIDWRRVARDYAGIIIAPYQWEFRLTPSFMWYYTWDCACGCVWSPDAIKSMTLLEERGVDERTIKREIHARMRFTPRKRKKMMARLQAARAAEAALA